MYRRLRKATHKPFHHFRWSLIHPNDVALLCYSVEEDVFPELNLIPQRRSVFLWRTHTHRPSNYTHTRLSSCSHAYPSAALSSMVFMLNPSCTLHLVLHGQGSWLFQRNSSLCATVLF